MRDLLTVRLETATGAIKHRRADYHGTDALLYRRLAYVSVHVDTRTAIRKWLEVAVIGYWDGRGILAVGVICDDRRPRSLDEGLSGALKRSNERHYGCRVVGTRRMNNR